MKLVVVDGAGLVAYHQVLSGDRGAQRIRRDPGARQNPLPEFAHIEVDQDLSEVEQNRAITAAGHAPPPSAQATAASARIRVGVTVGNPARAGSKASGISVQPSTTDSAPPRTRVA